MVKRNLIICMLSMCLLTGLFVHAQAPDKSEADDLARLKNSYKKRRTESLKSLDAWYEAQLQKLEATYTKKDDPLGVEGVKNELKQFHATQFHENAEGFRKALTASDWTWAGDLNQKGVKMSFYDEPYVCHIGMGGTWKITAPRDVTITQRDGSQITLRFDQKVGQYQQVEGQTVGRRWE